jgi:hypothetical protein
MKLFEVDTDAADAARTVLAVRKGQADSAKQPAVLQFQTVQQLLKNIGFTIGKPEDIQSLKSSIDPDGKIIDFVLADGTTVLNTKVKSNLKPDTAQPGVGPSVDKMATANANKFISKD